MKPSLSLIQSTTGEVSIPVTDPPSWQAVPNIPDVEQWNSFPYGSLDELGQFTAKRSGRYEFSVGRELQGTAELQAILQNISTGEQHISKGSGENPQAFLAFTFYLEKGQQVRSSIAAYSSDPNLKVYPRPDSNFLQIKYVGN